MTHSIRRALRLALSVIVSLAFMLAIGFAMAHLVPYGGWEQECALTPKAQRAQPCP